MVEVSPASAAGRALVKVAMLARMVGKTLIMTKVMVEVITMAQATEY